MVNPQALVGVVDSVPDAHGVPRIPVRFSLPSQTAYLNTSGDGSALMQRLLKGLSELKHPAFVTLAEGGIPGEPDIASVLIPKVSRVLDFEADGVGGPFHVRLEDFSARHTLAAPLVADSGITALLRDSVERGTTLFVTDDPVTHEIIDVRQAFDTFQRKLPLPGDHVFGAAAIEATSVIDEETLRRLFSAVTADRCGVPNPSKGCTAFVYPDDFCWARAQRLCEALAAMNLTTAKSWLYGRLEATTTNVRGCKVQWNWHCATLIRTSAHEIWVLDPALFCDQPVPYITWRESIRGIDFTLQSDASVYKMAVKLRGRGEIMPAESDQALELARLALDQRCNGRDGAPPYRC
jgi:hypothetical protein